MRNRNAEIGLELIICFDSIIKGIQGGPPKADSLATRLANLPALILDNGLVPTATFYLSKIDSSGKRGLLKALYERLMKLCDDGDTTLSNGEVRDIMDDLKGEAYVSATALLLAAMTQLGALRRIEGDDFIKSVAKALRDSLKSGAREEDDILEAVIEMKKVAAAFYKEKGRSRG